ncbi:hypothetical protein CR513_46107, partial [Mucuna pruriens]
MVLPLSEEVVTLFIIHGLGGQNGECLRKIQHAWKNVVKRRPEWGLWSCRASSTAAWEKYLRELEQDQALAEKEELTAALAGSESREAKAKNQLQERIILLEAYVARGKLHNEHLEQQRRQGLMELISE